MTKIFALIKFGEKEHLESLMHKGQMRFGALDSFAQSIQKERGDKFEGAFNIVNGQFSKIEYNHPVLGKGSFTPVPNTKGTIINFTDDPFFCFSSYALTSDCFNKTDIHKIDDRMMEFGEYALVIKEPNIFLGRVKSSLTELNYPFEGKLTSYLNFKQEGTVDATLFTKTQDLQHQFEHRILIKTERKQEEIFIEIGSIKNICFLSRTHEMLQTEFKGKRKSITTTNN
ncbi:hypothetical protein [Acidiluteibacter ferrifornacis]|uniref:Uncharacterized protein n=1 Tax=Acidiluteibacter ferrifornacis TaxID=2692424 RepID=A0A6N9NIE0_9FLAO|nr:hypothetical protein [Acidiluteibacter ferrifornacis]NBG65599.1 hypothetical protein [Acidiluteibacter ferrifornacis]